MPLLIDGHNLIPKIPGLSLSILDDEEILIKILLEYSRVARKKITLFFDNAPPGVVKIQRYGSITVQFVREGETADSAIRLKLKRLGKSAKNWSVVSSDREVQISARKAGAGVISSEDFAKSLFSIPNEGREKPDQKLENYPDELELQYWLDIFNRGSKNNDD